MRLPEWFRATPPFWVLLLLALALWGGEFVRRGLWEPDEARYAYVAREMHQDGHWFVPHINGEPYPDKPPLMFWMINASSLLTGGEINGVSTRLPSLLGVLMTLWVITRLLVRWHSTQAAWRAVLILLTTFMFWQEGGWGRIDPLLCGLVMLSVYFFFTSLDGHRGRRECLAYLFAGLAVFAKGPVGLVLPMGIFLTGAVMGDYGRRLQRSHWLWGPFVALAIPAAWLLVAWLQDAPADYFAAMFGEKSFGRVIDSSSHNRPFYYFLLHYPMELMPWTLFLPAAIVACSNRTLKRMLLGSILFVLVLFSLFVCKRHVYILTVYPLTAMLIAAAWEDISRLSRRWVTVTGSVAIGLLGLMAVAATASLFVPQIPFSRLLLVPSVVILLAGSVLLGLLFRRERLSQRWFVAYTAVLFLMQVSFSAIVQPALNSRKGPIEAASAVSAILPPDQPVYLYRQQLAIFPLYANRRGREVDSVEALQEILAEQHQAIVVFHHSQWLEIASEFPGVKGVHDFLMGHKRLCWVEFAPRPQS